MASPFLIDTLSGLVGASLLVATGNPFETAKLRLQTQPGLYRSPLHCLTTMVRSEGLSSLWKGASPALVSSMLENAVLFAANGALRRLLVSVDGGDESSITPLQQGIIGGMSGVVSATAICPAEVVKCRMQYQHSDGAGKLYRNGGHAFASIVRQEGVKALFSGLPALLARDVPFNFLFWGSYRGYCSLLHDLAENPATRGGAGSGLPSHEDIPGWMALVAGSMAGGTAWAIVFPFDVLKSRAQVAGMATAADAGAGGGAAVIGGSASSSSNIFQTFRAIVAADGYKALYRGASAAITRGFVANGALFFGQNLAGKLMAKAGLVAAKQQQQEEGEMH